MVGKKLQKVIVFPKSDVELPGMYRYFAIALIFFMLFPAFSPLASAHTQCGEACAVSKGQHCTHGEACPVHGNKKTAQKSSHGHHHEGMEMEEDEEEELICHVSAESNEHGNDSRQQSCLTISGCADHGAKSLNAPIFTGDYLVVSGNSRLDEPTSLIPLCLARIIRNHPRNSTTGLPLSDIP